MATTPGAVQDFSKLHVVIAPDGFRYDAFDTGGVVGAWEGDAFTLVTGPDGVPYYVGTKIANCTLTLNLQANSNGILFSYNWLLSGIPKTLSLKVSPSATFLVTATALPRQRPGFTYNGAANPWSIDIHCPSFTGPLGGVLPATG